MPAGVDRDDLELNVQIALIAPTIAVDGFSAPSVAEVSSRAITLCRTLNDDPRIFPALYARWSNFGLPGAFVRPVSLPANSSTLPSGRAADGPHGRASVVGTALIDWDTARVASISRRRVALYDRSRDNTTALVYGTDVQVTSLCNLSIGYWLLGRVSQARRDGE